jgi:hypothetical protein
MQNYVPALMPQWFLLGIFVLAGKRTAGDQFMAAQEESLGHKEPVVCQEHEESHAGQEQAQKEIESKLREKETLILVIAASNLRAILSHQVYFFLYKSVLCGCSVLNAEAWHLHSSLQSSSAQKPVISSPMLG